MSRRANGRERLLALWRLDAVATRRDDVSHHRNDSLPAAASSSSRTSWIISIELHFRPPVRIQGSFTEVFHKFSWRHRKDTAHPWSRFAVAQPISENRQGEDFTRSMAS
jgi:hypothetical protein